MSCELLAGALQRHNEFEVNVCSDAGRLMQFLVEHVVDVAVISARVGDDPRAGFDRIRRVREISPSTHIIALLDSGRREVVVEAFRAGAHGIFCRTDSHKLLPRCIARVNEGQIWASSKQIQMALEALSEPVSVRVTNANGDGLLTKREQAVASLVASGLSNREIAKQLELSEHTIKNYLFRIFERLGISNRVELVLYSLTNNGHNGHTVETPQVAAKTEPKGNGHRKASSGQDSSTQTAALRRNALQDSASALHNDC